jgi:integrase
MTATTDGKKPDTARAIEFLDRLQLDRLTEVFRRWRETAASDYTRRVRGRYWLAFLMLRHTGARIGEILRIDDAVDIDYRQSEVRIVSADSLEMREVLRTIPVPAAITSEVLAYLSEFPVMRGKVLALDQGNFRREFYRRARDADLPRELSHPHILRHTRAIELVEAGVPLNAVRDLLGHALSSTTAIYLRRSDVTLRWILVEKGLL